MRRALLRIMPLLLVLTSLSAGYLYCDGSTEVKPPPPVDIIATGGAGLTSYDKFGMLFMNPAAFALYNDLLVSVLRAGISANYDLYNYYSIFNALSQNGMNFSALSPTQWQELINANAELGVEGPIALGFLWQGIGVLFYNDFQTTLQTMQEAGFPYFNYDSYADFVCLAGFGFKIPVPVFLGKFSEVYAGVNVKYINRLEYSNPRMSLLEAYDTAISIAVFQNGFLWGQAIGSDAGLMLKSEDLALGLVMRDWFGTQFSWREYAANGQQIISPTNLVPTYWAPELDVGSSYTVKSVLPKYLLGDVTFYFDLDDILNFTQDFFLKVRLGAELGVFSFLKLRAGFYEGYPTAGFGLVFPLITINAAYFTEELGELPGSEPQQNYELEIDIIL